MAPLAVSLESRMRLALVLVLSLAVSGCAIVRKDKEEPVESPAARHKAEPVLKPSDVLKPDSRTIPSPVTDRFSMRIIYFQPSVTTNIRLDATDGTPGTLLSAEDDLGLDDVLNQMRVEVDMRMVKHHHLRVDFFKAGRFQQGTLARDIRFGDFIFDAGTQFRANLDWRTFSITYMYMPLLTERIEAGFLHGIHVVQTKASGGEPGTLNRESASEVGIYPTFGLGGTFRFTRRFALTARGEMLIVDRHDFTAKMADIHADVQFRWRPNVAFGLGYTKLTNELELFDIDQTLLFNMDTNGPELFARVSF
jgi:hypothetical protein